jgi:thioredoxin reductase (NADPH)
MINLERESVDCLVVGGGPAGLAAATYLGRFRLSAVVHDSGESRAASIPCTRNQPGFPEGITGADLLGRMRQQGSHYGVRCNEGLVTALAREDGRFRASTSGREILARTVILATGVRNRRPDMDRHLHDEALAQGRLRYCPICDGYEVTDKRVAVIGTGGHGVKEAEFLRSYSARITLVCADGPHDLDWEMKEKLTGKGIVILDGPASHFVLQRDSIAFRADGSWLQADTVYPALGSHICSELGAAVGAEQTREGCIKVDAHQRTNVPGLYAAGDVVPGLDQISVAIGQAALAATAVRNDLSGAGPLLR